MKNHYIIIIAAVEDKTFAIGKNNKLLYHIPADLKRFKELTTGKNIIMGWNTFKSLPNGPLPNRTNIVLVESVPNENYENVIWATSIDDALSKVTDTKPVYIIGGASIYKQFINIADEIELTVIRPEKEEDYTKDADAFFPEKELKEQFIILSPDTNNDPIKQSSFKFYYQNNKGNLFEYNFVNYVRNQENLSEMEDKM